jgi:hypothetical protein
MTEPWFDPRLYAWIPGTVLGVVGGILGSLSGTLAPRGKARALVLGLFSLVLCATVLLLIAGLFAFFAGQPYGVWYGLLLPGFLGTVVFGVLVPVILKRYREAEERRLTAHDI